MNLHITKSKNAESFYICRSYAKDNGSTTSTIVRKLGTLENLLIEHGPTRDDVIAWAKNEVKAETEKYKKDKEAKLRNAVYGNLKLMRKTLSAEQYAKYAALMNLTLLNKGIDLSK